MLINFYLENCLSYKDFACLSMQANKKNELKKEEDKPENIFEIDEGFLKKGESNRFLKTAVIYGANASGKTNLIRAMKWLKDFVVKSKSNNENTPLEFIPFLFSEKTECANLGIEFIAGDENKYKYTLCTDAKLVFFEKLEIFNKKSKNYKSIFVREFDKESIDKDKTVKYNYEIKYPNKKDYMSNFNKKDFDRIENKCTHNKSLIPILEEEGIEVVKFVWRWFATKFYVFSNLNPDIRDSYFKYENGDGHRVSDLLFKLGLGKLEPIFEVSKADATNLNIPFETTFILFKDRKIAILKGFKHNGVFVSIKNESSGLIATYAFIGTLLNIFERGLVLVIDELDRHLHPDIVASIIKMVNDPELNPKNGQLIFNTHSDSLLDNDIDLFRREQVWFIEKLSDEKGSKLFSFDDIEDYEDKRGNKRKVYRSGKIGARPYIREALLKFLGGNSEQEKR